MLSALARTAARSSRTMSSVSAAASMTLPTSVASRAGGALRKGLAPSRSITTRLMPASASLLRRREGSSNVPITRRETSDPITAVAPQMKDLLDMMQDTMSAMSVFSPSLDMPLLDPERTFLTGPRSLVDSRLERLREQRISLDVEEMPDRFEVKADLPGVDINEVRIAYSPDADILSIDVQREKVDEKEEKDEETDKITCHMYERAIHYSRRKVHIPSHVDRKAIKAGMKNGVLKITLPKVEESSDMFIKIEGSSEEGAKEKEGAKISTEA